MYFIGIDPSLNSTSVTINGNCLNYAPHNIVYTKKNELKKWYNFFKNIITYRTFHKPIFNKKSHNISETQKLKMFDDVCDLIIFDIVEKTKNSPEKTHICIEGYSYSSSSGPLIDLVTFATILKYKLYYLYNYKHISVIPPKSLKKFAGKLTYKKVIENRKEMYRNKLDIPSGNFNKKDLLNSLIDNTTLNYAFTDFLKQNKKIQLQKKVPKPLEDCVDSFLLYKHAQCTLTET